MVKETAHAGRGSYSIVSDKNVNELNGLVINALKKAIEPSLKECRIWLGNDNSILHEVYRNQTVSKIAIMSKANFEKVTFGFVSEKDPTTG